MDVVVASVGSAARSVVDPLRAMRAGPVVGVLLILLGLAVSFKGYDWRRVFLAVGGLLSGGLLGAVIAATAHADREGILVLAGVGAATLAVLAYFLYYVALALFGAAAGGAVGFLVGSLGGDLTASLIAGGVLALAGALITIRGEQLVFIIVSAAVGGVVAAMGVRLIPPVPPAAVVVPCVVGGLAFRLFGRERSRQRQVGEASGQGPKGVSGAALGDADRRRCPKCGYPNSAAATVCGLCSTRFGGST